MTVDQICKIVVSQEWRSLLHTISLGVVITQRIVELVGIAFGSDVEIAI